MSRVHKRHPFVLLLALLALAVAPASLFAERCPDWAGKAVSVQGDVELRQAGADSWVQIQPEEHLCAGDTVRVGPNSRASLQLSNQSVMRLNENTTFTLTALEQEGKPFVVEMLRGAAHFLSRKPRSLDVNTPYTIAGVRGTEFFVGVEEGRTDILVFEGMVLAQNQHGQVELGSGQSAAALEGQAPVQTVLVRPRDAVSWALYYPSVGLPERDPAVSAEALHAGQRASELLAVGQADRANEELEQALRIDPDFAEAYALQSIIALVRNENQRAADLSERALQIKPDSATAWLARSYVQQSMFQVEEARASREQAVQAEPSNGLAWAALAESWAMNGNLNRALEAAERAVELQPDLALTQKVLGFVHLMQVRTDQARQAFLRAIELDQADPMPRLGLGLAEFRDGDVAEGQRQIEIAASLDPNRSLIRSYLGKAFFEQKRSDVALREFDIAKELDPSDPTPWFYSAVTKQTTNRPVEAMQDYQRAIELNDNRAVYRSRLLLDSDLAARNAALGRLYGELGFEQLALSEGFKAVNQDPANFSAHRFLADLYAGLPRHEIARVSALLQSQLLQPINLTPIQPTLAESNLFLISAMGPTALSFNEFNPLFERRQRVAFLGSGLVGENDTWAAEGVLSAIYGRMSLSGGYTHFETDGWRENAFQEDDLLNLFAQYQITHNTSILAEFRSRDLTRGDTELRFFEDDFLSQMEQDESTEMARFGIRHDFLPGHTLLGHFTYQSFDYDVLDLPDVPFISSVESGTGVDSYTGELSYILRSNNFSLMGGAGYVKLEKEKQLVVEFPEFFGIPPFVSESDSDVRHTNAYIYSLIELPMNLSVTLGVSGDFYDTSDEDGEDEDQFNPKIGILWKPWMGTTLRAAAFRTFTRTLPTDQTLEPTQVAGFNQFFDDPGRTDAWRYGVGVDQKVTDSIYAGAEYSKRKLEVPYFSVEFVPDPDLGEIPVSTFRKADWDEDIFRSYIYWTPHKWVSLSAEAYFEKHRRDEEFGGGIRDLDTWFFPLGITFFHSSGLSASLTGTYYDQEGSFNRLDADEGVFEEGDDQFWVVDASIRYRIPNRHGFITLGVKNLFDKDFQYQDTDWRNPRITPGRMVFASVTLALP
jgi:tetratricopeptide (TPR) repeat protein